MRRRPDPAWLLAGLLALTGTAHLVVPAALLVGILPGNVTMAVRSAGRPAWYRALVWGRLPLQVPLIWWALRAGRDPGYGRLGETSYR